MRLGLPDEDGWSPCPVDGGPPELFVRSGRVNGREVLTGIRLETDGGQAPITGTMLRAIPLTDLEYQLNAPLRARALAALRGEPADETEGPAEMHAAVVAEGGYQRRAAVRVRPPKKAPYPDAFYKRVAAAYNRLVADGQQPAPIIAEANGVPISSVHGWVKEARRRGALPTGRKGKAG